MGLSQRRRQVLGRLGRRKTRARDQLVLVEGVRAVAEAVAAGASARFALVSPRLAEVHEGAALRLALEAAGIEAQEVEDAELASVCDTEHPQGVLLVCAEPAASDAAVRPGGRYLVLDAVQDPGNVGTLVRAATAFALDGVLALDGTADPWSPKAVRASAGLAFRMPVLARTAEAALALLEAADVPLLVADVGGADVDAVSAPRGWALAVANEGAGPRAALRRRARTSVRIPMPGPAESLNAGVAGAILLYALTEKAREETRGDR